MHLEPKNLNIPLARKSRFWLWAVAIVALAGLLLRAFSPAFGTVFLASAILVLPVLALYLFRPWPVPPNRPTRAGQVVALVFVLLYALVAKNLLLPWLVERMP